MINDDLSEKKSPHFRVKYLVLSYLEGKLPSQIIIPDLVGFFVEFDWESPRSKIEQEHGQQTAENSGHKISSEDAASVTSLVPVSKIRGCGMVLNSTRCNRLTMTGHQRIDSG